MNTNKKVYGISNVMPMACNSPIKESTGKSENYQKINFPTFEDAKNYMKEKEMDGCTVESISYHAYNPLQDPRIDWNSPRTVGKLAVKAAKDGQIKDAKKILEEFANDCSHPELLSIIQTLQKNWNNGEWSDEMRELEKHLKEFYNAETSLEKQSVSVRA